jgi:hypothetical protein
VSDDLEAKVRDWLHADAPRAIPDSLAARLSAAPSKRSLQAHVGRRPGAGMAFAFMAAVVVLAVGTVFVFGLGSGPPASPPPFGTPSATPGSTNITAPPSPSMPEATSSAAMIACTSALPTIADEAGGTGQLNVAGAFAVTGEQFARWQEQQAARAGFGITSPWHDNPDAALDICFVDGDFSPALPGPTEGIYANITRVVVKLEGGGVNLWTVGTQDNVPVVDPTTLGPSTSQAPPTPLGIPEARAVQLAREHVSSDAVFASAMAGRLADVYHGDRTPYLGPKQLNRLVWAVDFDSMFTICPPDGSACYSPRPGFTTVVLDQLTGDFILSSGFSSQPVPSPAPASVLTPRDITDQHLDLEPIPPGTPAGISQSEAVTVALDTLKALGGTGSPLLVERGMGVVGIDKPRQPVWLVVVATSSNPVPGGPPCPTSEPCDRPILVDDIAGAVVSDETGEVLRMFSRGHTVTPSPSNSASTGGLQLTL